MKFGTSGLRGRVSDMTDARCAAYATAFLRHLADSGAGGPAVLVGRDLRPSSPRIASACIGAIRAAGLEAVDCGVLPTPALALEAAARSMPAIMVTGSHIPFDRNGLKFYRPEGEITKADEGGILAALDRPEPSEARHGGVRTDDGARARYLARARAFPTGALKGRRIGVYEHSAAGRDLLGEALTALGAETVSLGRSDAFIPIDTEAVRPEDRALARAWSAEHRLDALVSTDGDGDRPLIADETGAVLRGDLLGMLAARWLGADAVATPISSSTALERSGWFPRVARTRIGSPYVIEAMARLAQAGARRPVGFEPNGGFLLGAAARPPGGTPLDPLPTRDALVPILAALCMAAERGRALSALSASLPRRETASDRITEAPSSRAGPFLAALRDDPAARARLLSTLGGPAVLAVDATDGVRMTLEGDEIAHLRASGNAPELRCYAEAAEATRAETIVAALLEAARAEMVAL
jgi:phosphomannomutase